MATEATVNSAKKEWTDAAAKAASDKVNAKESYEEEKGYSSITGSFNDWAPKNAFQFIGSYQNYVTKLDAFYTALGNHDPAKYKDLSNKHSRLRNHWYQGDLGDGKEKGSDFIIISYDDLERYDEIMNAMYKAKQEAAQS